MKSFEEIVRERPYLERVIELYRLLYGLKSLAEEFRVEPVEDMSNYPEVWAGKVVRIIVDAFGLSTEVHGALVRLLSDPSVDIRKVPLEEEMSLPVEGVSQREMKTVLYLYSKVFFMAEKQRLNLDGVFWQEGKCPVCHSTPAVSLIEPEQKRQFYCNYCGTVGPYERLTCPACHRDYSEGLEIVMFESEQGIRADLCPECKLYWKSFDSEMLRDYDYDILDLISLPLDIALQDRGYHRGCPNPIGMKDMKESSEG